MDNIWGSMAQYQKITWGWQIAVYLFLAGLSAGALIAAVLTKWKTGKDSGYDGLTKAGALLAMPSISAGLGLLIFDLGKPLSFWLLMIHFNLNSIMSVGVILLSLHSLLTTVFAVIIFRKELSRSSLTAWIMKPFAFVLDFVEGFGRWFDYLMLAIAVCIAAYTGFLLSVLVAKPLLNVAVLPLLFLVSGISSGLAAAIFLALLFFKQDIAAANLKALLRIDGRMIPVEMLVLFTLFAGLYNMGGHYSEIALQAISIGIWAKVLWIGIVGLGLFTPLLLTFSLHSYENSSSAPVPTARILLNCTLVLLGVILVRFYVLYAGQTFI